MTDRPEQRDQTAHREHPILGVAVVGCGVIGQTHAAAIGELERMTVVALVDADAGRAAALADTVEATTGARPRTFASLEEAVAAEVVAEAVAGEAAIDVVVIATPSGMHVDQARIALAADKHVVIEKPVDVELGRAIALARAAREAAERGTLCTVISQHRFDPASQIVARAIGEQRFGRITSAVASVAWWRSQDYYDSGDWRGTWSLDGGGALMNQGVHTVDLLLWFLGTPVSVSAEFGLLAHEHVEVEDTIVATVAFESGALAVLHATTAAYPGLTVRIQVLGSAGSAIIDSDRLEYFHASIDSTAQATADMGLLGGGNQADRYREVDEPGLAGIDATQFTLGHIRQYQDLLSAIDEKRSPAVTVDDAVLALATVRAAYVSATTGDRILIADMLAGRHDDVVPAVTRRPHVLDRPDDPESAR